MIVYILAYMKHDNSGYVKTTRKVVVVGGGPAGLIAAGEAAGRGAETLLLERMKSCGRKLSITGKGRCNLTNSASLADFLEAFGPNGKFLRQAFMAYFNSDLVAFIESLGVPIELERGGRYFPVDNNAPEIAQALARWAGRQGVTIRPNSQVTGLAFDDEKLSGLELKSGKKLPVDAVVVATGGLSYPGTGSTGDGYAWAEAVGHTVVPTRPALVPVETRGNLAQRLQGLSLRNVTATLLVDDQPQTTMLGEMLFTHFGLSGPIILQMSQLIVDALAARKEVAVSLDLKPGLDERKLEARLLRDFKSLGKKQFNTILKELLPSSLIPVCCDLCEIPPEATGNQITTAERRRLRKWLKDFRLEVSGYRSYDEAIITAGGIDLKEIDPRTMESKIVPGLYFAGEILDLDGPTGGYNLQVAFSTGWLAGRAAAADAES